MRKKGSCRSQSGLKPPMKRCIQDGYCQKNRENEKSAKIEAYLSLQDKKLFLLPYGEKSSKQKKIYNKGKNIENEEKQDKT